MSRMLVDKDAIRVLAEILTDTGLTEIEIAEKESRIRVVRSAAPVASAGATLPISAPAQPATPGPAVAASDSSSGHILKSPMVGVVYLAPDPSSPPFVQEGQHVAVGQTLMLIEAMKTFNQIKSPWAGVLKSLLVESGQPVEFDEPLAIIE